MHSLQGPYDESGVIVSTSPVVFGGESVNICSDLHKAPSVAVRSQMTMMMMRRATMTMMMMMMITMGETMTM